MNVPAQLLAAAIVVTYVLTLWRLLRSESAWCLWILALLSVSSLLLRLVQFDSYPGGLNDDESKVLYGAIQAWAKGNLIGEGATGLPQLIPVLFQAQLVPLLGGGRWAIRAYSIAGSVLSVAGTFAVARAMRMRPISSLAAAAFVVFLPWSVFYGRISQGGELLFNQVLLLAALARLVWRDGNWREIPAGALGLCLLFYDYFSGRSMLAMPFVAAVLAKGRKRLWCLAIAVVGFIGFLPQALSGHRYALVGLTPLQVHPSYSANVLDTLATTFYNHLTALAYPTAANGWMTVSSGAMHPWLVLGLAVLGLLTGFRRALFLLAGFVVGLMPSIVAHGDLTASAHRMHAAYVFIALAAGASFDLIRWRTLRAATAFAVVSFVAVWSVTFYFSAEFWRPEARWMFDNESTDVVEAIPWNEPHVIAADLGYPISVRTDLQPTEFGVEHLALPKPALYAFGPRMGPLQAFYDALLRPGAVQSYGRSFTIRSNPWDVEWLRGHGWTYTVVCGDQRRSGEIVTLFHVFYSFSDFVCAGPTEHIWKAKWHGPQADMRLWFNGNASVQLDAGQLVSSEPGKLSLDFKAEPGAEISVRVAGPARVLAALYVVTPRLGRLPYWEWVEPVALPGAAD